MPEAMRRAATVLIAFGIALSALLALGTLIGLARHGPRWDIVAALGIMVTLLAVLLVLLRRLEADADVAASKGLLGETGRSWSVSGGRLAAALLVLMLGLLLAGPHTSTMVFGGLTLVMLARDLRNVPRGAGMGRRILCAFGRSRPLVPGPLIGILAAGLYALGLAPGFLTPLDIVAFVAFACTVDPRGSPAVTNRPLGRQRGSGASGTGSR